ncbi:MAG: 5-formyltetrahydrofolate cyclo-ligase [Actinomycetota bacterium]
MGEGTSSVDAKTALRRDLRAVRRALPDRPERSERIRQVLTTLESVVRARRVLVFSTIVGEPEMAGVVEDLQRGGAEVGRPEDEFPPTWPEVVIAPGLAFTPAGARLGQGGGWYDRFLADVSPGCTTIGVCFREQVLDDLPIEPHDIAVDIVVTDRGVVHSAG